jgi:hypothetical protein
MKLVSRDLTKGLIHFRGRDFSLANHNPYSRHTLQPHKCYPSFCHSLLTTAQIYENLDAYYAKRSGTASTGSQFWCHTSVKEPFFSHIFASLEQQAASSAVTQFPASCCFATTPLSKSQFCSHTFAYLDQAAISLSHHFQQGASSAATPPFK